MLSSENYLTVKGKNNAIYIYEIIRMEEIMP